MMKRFDLGQFFVILFVVAACAAGSCSGGSRSRRNVLVYEIRGATYEDANGNGLVDGGDRVTVTFDSGVVVQGGAAADGVFTLDPPGTFGTGAVITPVAAQELEIILQGGASLQPNGTYGVEPDSTGLNLAPSQTAITDPPMTPLPPLPVPLDLAGEVRPRIAAVTLADTNGNCRIDPGDTLDIDFSMNVTLTTADPAQAFVLPVTADTLGTNAQFVGGGMPTNVPTVSITIGAGAVFEGVGTFDPLDLTPGSPSGIDVAPAGGWIVEASHPSVSASAASPPGVDIPESGLDPLLWWTLGDDRMLAELGTSVDSAGDVNGDGYPDVIIGAPAFLGSGPRAGKAYVYLGGASGLSATPVWTSLGDDQGGADYGSSVSAAGDVNDDGFGDIIVGAQWYDDINSNAGKAYVYLGGTGGPSPTPVWTSSGEQLGSDRFGVNVDSAGDVNNDGFGDIVVAASYYPSSASFVGKAYVYLGGPTGPSTVADWSSLGDDQPFANYGLGCAGAGDVDGDGFSDVVVGAPGFDTTNNNAGKVYLYLGAPGGLSPTPIWTSTGEDMNMSQFGSALSSAGDVDNDGFSDILIGANIFGTGFLGKAYLYLGSPTGPGPSPIWSSSGDSQPDARFGTAVGSAGDVNNDGFSDILVGVPAFSTLFPDAGKVYLYLGGAGGPGPSPDWTSSGDDQGDAWFGISVSSADVDRNGFSEVLIGASFFDSASVDAGKAYLFCAGP